MFSASCYDIRMYQIPEHIKEESKIIRTEFSDKMVGFIVGALSLVAGLAWNDAIKALIEYVFPLQKDGISAKFIYAIVISLVVVMISIFLVRWFKPEGQK